MPTMTFVEQAVTSDIIDNFEECKDPSPAYKASSANGRHIASTVALAARLFGAYGSRYEITECQRPIPGPGEALVRLEYSGICHGDVYSRDGGGPAPPLPIRPLTGGHEGVGTILGFGVEPIANPTKGHNLKIGDTVGIAWRFSVCNQCDACLSGAENHCPDQVINGLHRDGTFRRYVAYPANELIPIPPSVPLTSVCPILCAGVTAFTGLRKLQPEQGKWIAISGAAGGLGHLAIQYAKVLFKLRVLAIDGGDENKEAFCKQLGCDEYLDFTKFPGSSLAKEVVRRTGGGVHYALVLSPNQSAYDAAGEYCRFRGRVVAIGVGNCHFPLRPVLKKNLTVQSSETGNRQDMIDVLEASRSSAVRPVIEIVPLSHINEAMDQIKKGEVFGKLVVDLK